MLKKILIVIMFSTAYVSANPFLRGDTCPTGYCKMAQGPYNCNQCPYKVSCEWAKANQCDCPDCVPDAVLSHVFENNSTKFSLES